jgi:hypothetical protein
MVKFWLDMKHIDQQWIAEVVAELRKRRQLARTIREGIALVVTLRQGDLSVLDDLFPFVRETTRTPSPTQASEQFNAILHELNELKAQQGRAFPAYSEQKGRAAVEVAASKASAETVAKNFLTSMKGLASGFFD